MDVSAPLLAGAYLSDKPRKLLVEMAKSPRLWDRRIAILATFWFIRDRDFALSIRLARMMLRDEHDLMHKAIGWMLREIGKRERAVLEEFLDTHASRMPRTMLRYAIEKFPPEQRRRYLSVPREAITAIKPQPRAR